MSARHPIINAGRTQGFTLIEVLIALAVLAIALAAILRTMGQSVNTAIALRDRTVAQWIAEDRLARHEIRGDWISVGIRDGTSTEGGHEWRWTETVAGTPIPGYRRIDISVRRRDGRRPLGHLVGFLRKAPPTP